MLGSIAELVHNAHRGHEAVKATLDAINQMQADGVIGKCAIGGAVGTTFYLEPAATLDVDIFVVLPTASGGSLPSRSPIYNYLKARGGTIKDEHIVIGGWPVRAKEPLIGRSCIASSNNMG